MERRMFGQLSVPAIGLGCMSMTPIYAQPDEGEAIATVQHALDHGVELLDTSDAYAAGANESLIGKAVQGRRDKAIIATKFGNLRTPEGKQAVCGDPDYVRQACEASLKRLGVEEIDLYLAHRIDPDVPIEDTVGAMADLVQAGKVRHLGLCEAAPETLRRAHATHPIAALQTEYSLWSRDAEADVLPLCAELGVGYMAYAPLGRGFLTGTIRDTDALAESDRRRAHPRFHPENLSRNLALVEQLDALAQEAGCTPAQLSLAWVLGQGGHIVPIPGTSRRKWLRENIAAAQLQVAPDILGRLSEAFRPGIAAGLRYPEGQMKHLRV
ncbi:aldo/keto reductase [Alkalilacustris brevis]|uniref:aldo/keto reductase n=1 Tax=Alkalilacustris brevis TaxID=2026338 RepID=UPI000E0D5B8E|nr:aldo/keto reductase [Alkalilacustris brevis]